MRPGAERSTTFRALSKIIAMSHNKTIVKAGREMHEL